jgi:hypothetical protein
MIKYWIIQVVLLFLLVGTLDAENVPAFRHQTIEVPMSRPYGLWPYWKDIQGDGLTDLLVLSQEKRLLYIYNQNQAGFPAEPTQTIKFPEGVAWFAIYNVNEYPGDEMLVSTHEGLMYYRQHNGIFEIEPQKLLEAKQVIPLNHPPIIIYIDMGPKESKDVIPVVFSDQTIIYKCDEKYQLKPERTIEHEFNKSIVKSLWNTWNLGSKTSSQLWITTTARGKTDEAIKEKKSIKENETIEKFVKKIKEDRSVRQYNIEEKDINADGREDLVLWYYVGEVDIKTTIAVFIRQEDGKLPENASQVLGCSGFPVDSDKKSLTILTLMVFMKLYLFS